MDWIFDPETLEAARNVLTALGGLLVAARPVAAAFHGLAKITPFKWDDHIAAALNKVLGLFTPKGK